MLVDINYDNVLPEGLYPMVADILSGDLSPPLPNDLNFLLLNTELCRYQLC